MLLKLLYTRGSLHNQPDGNGVAFSIKNRLDTVRLTSVQQVQLGAVTVPADHIRLDLGGGDVRRASALGAEGQAVDLPVGQALTFLLDTPAPAAQSRLRPPPSARQRHRCQIAPAAGAGPPPGPAYRAKT
ncbi:MAG: hypothetical protein EOO56_26465 [Hymenobacter sp.]|nr:MAG: hypothetical protein EOO56_26465 [Hymenobacter sp.]